MRLLSILMFSILSFMLMVQCSNPASLNEKSLETASGAGQSMDFFAMARTFPDGKYSSKAYKKAFRDKQLNRALKSGPDASDWNALGPFNIGGRTLCMGFNHQDDETLWIGTASGGLWRTYVAGVGVGAWERIETGFPVLGVGAIWVSPTDSNTIVIGTGEVYNGSAASPGVTVRTTRGSYGVGILKTTDGGVTWTKTLDWNLDDLTGVQHIEPHPSNPNTLFAATTEGLYVSYNAGNSWTILDNQEMAVDLWISPVDTNRILLSNGSFNDPNSGVRFSPDFGQTWFETILPQGYTGKTKLTGAPSNPDFIYASVANNFESIGLYLSTDGGFSWTFINGQDVARWQGWYAHDLAVKPDNANSIIYVGIDTWRSINAGITLEQRSNWTSWTFGIVPEGGPEGGPDYVHADIHAVYYHPNSTNRVYFATDGGVFVSEDNGTTFSGRNGGLQNTQFYANFDNADWDSTLAIGGMQDNSTAIYRGQRAWQRVIGGDGMSAAISPANGLTLYGSAQFLNLRRSDNDGASFYSIISNEMASETKNFAGPYEISPEGPEILYAGAERLHRSNNGGLSWSPTSISPVDNGNPILTIEISEANTNLIYVSTSPITNGAGGVFKTTNDGASWIEGTGLPNRVFMDIVAHPSDENIAFAVCSGFGTDHLWRTSDKGVSWQAWGFGLPDVPTNTLVFHPTNPDILYVGNDLGVYWSINGGLNWELFSNGLPDAVMVMHLSISLDNMKLRVATHGIGVWESPLVDDSTVSIEPTDLSPGINVNVFPNPVQSTLNLEIDGPNIISGQLMIFDNLGRQILPIQEIGQSNGTSMLRVDVQNLPMGTYHYLLETANQGQVSGSFTKQ
ncbi:MAG: T9SS type A sorting domain-containing protein [Bacteroidota bacterium]